MTLSEQVAKLEKELAELKQKQKEFSIEGYRWFIQEEGRVINGPGVGKSIANHYNYFKTKKIAEKVAKEQRLTNFISNIAYTSDDGIWEADWNNQKQIKYYVTYDNDIGEWKKYGNQYIKSVCTYMSESTADKVIEELTRLAKNGELL